MVSLYFAVIFIGVLTLLGIFFWLRQRERVRRELDWASTLREIAVGHIGQPNAAVIVCSEHGQLLYMNDLARHWTNAHDRRMTLEDVARQAQPFDNFIELLTTEDRTSFQLAGHWLEGQSYFVPAEDGRRTVVILHEMTEHAESPPGEAGGLGMSRMMTVIDEISRTVNAGMGVELALQVLLEIVNKAMPSDAGEICLWNAQDQYLVQRGWIGDTRYLLAISTQGGGYEAGRGVAGWMLKNNQPLRISGTDAMSVGALMSDNPYTSAVGVPLWLGEQFVGTLTMFSHTPNHYTTENVTLLQAINTAVATAIRNAELYAQQEDRIRDIASLQEIAEQPKGDNDSRPIYRLLNERMAKLMLSDVCGVFVYDEERRALMAQLPFYGLPDQIAQRLLIPLPPGSPQRDVWENQPYWASNDLTDEPLVEGLHLLDIVRAAGLYNTAIFPLQIAGERIGAIAICNRQSEGGFTPNDIQNLRVLSSQAALVVENLRLYQRERRIDTELIGLQEMTYAIGALSHRENFYHEINERISRLMDSAMCGVLLYDAERNALIAQMPFYGIAPEIVQDYEIQLPTGSVMEQLWQEEDIWFSNRVATDPLVYAAGLDELAERAGLHNTIFATMSAGGRKIGVIQVSNKHQAQNYDDKDARLLQIFAAQAGVIIENARLVREVQVRADQAERLRQIAERASKVITFDESFKPVLEQVALLTESEYVFINVVDNNTNMLLTYPHWVYGVELHETITQDLGADGYAAVAARSGVPFLSNYVQKDQKLLAGYKRIVDEYGLRSAVIVPLMVGDRILGEIGIANKQRGPYTANDQATLGTVAAQIASAVERLMLFEVTDENLRRRLEELDAIARVSNELTLTNHLDSILPVIATEAIKATKADDCTIVLLLPNDQWRVADQPELERRMGNDISALEQLADIEFEAIMRGAEALVVDDYAHSDLTALPPTAAAAAAAAILYLDQVIGVIHVYSATPNNFDERASRFLMTLASKASLAYQNADLYSKQEERGQRLRQRVDQLNRIFELGQMVQTTADTDVVLEAVAYSIQQSVGFDTVLMTLFDENTGVLRRVAHAGMPLDVFEKTRNNTMSAEGLARLLDEDYLVDGTMDSYFFPIETLRDWYFPEASVLSTAYDENRSLHSKGKQAWRDGDMLVVRMNGQGGNIIGLVSLDRPYNNKRPDRAMVEVLEIFAHQAAAMIENARLFAQSHRNAELEAHLSDVVEQMTRSFDMTHIARILAQGLKGLVPFNRLTLVALDEDDQISDYIKAVLQANGDFHISSEPRKTLERTALERTISDSEESVYTTRSDWVQHFEDLRAWYAQGEQTTLILPLLSGGECIGALHIGSDQDDSLIEPETRQLLRRTARLVSSTVQNARLYNQAVSLQILNRSVVESIQQGIVVLDNSGRIISINDFMRKVYGWDDSARQRDLFEYRPELSEILSDDLRDVLELGEHRERVGQDSPDAANEISVRNFYMYPLRNRDQVRGAVLLVEDVTERTRLEEAIEQRANQLAALTEVSTRITASLEREEVIALAMDEMGWIIPFDTMTIWRRNGSYMLLEGVSGADLDVVDADVRLRITDDTEIEQLVESQRVVSINRADAIPQLGLPETDRAESWMGVPLVNQGHVVGMFVLTRDEPRAYDTRQEHHVALAFASQVAIALANADLFEQTFERTNELGTLLEAAQATSLTRNNEEVFRVVAELLFSALEMEDCAIMILDAVSNSLEVVYSTNRMGADDLNITMGTHYSVSDYPARARALKQQDVVVIVDVEDEDKRPPYPRELDEMRRFGRGARMLVPLVVREQSRGLIQLEQTSNAQHVITQQKVRLARALGAQVAIAIENSRLATETTAHVEELLTINQLSQSISATLNLDDMIPIIRDQVLQVTHAEELYLALYDDQTATVRFPLAVRSTGEQFVIEPRELGKDEVSYVIRQRHPLNLGADYFSIGIDEVRRSMGIVTGEGDAKAYLGVPVRSSAQVLGVLAIRNIESSQFFTVNEIRILETVGSQLGAAIQNARLFERVQESAEMLERLVDERTDELEAERDRLDTLYQITSELARTLDMEQLLDRSLGMVSKAVGADDGVILLTDAATDALYSKAWLNPNHVYVHPQRSMKTHPSEGLAEWLIHNDDMFDHVVVVDDLDEEAYWDERGRATGLRSALAVLLEHNEDAMGVMVLLSSQPGAFTENHLKLLVPAANQVAASINSADLYQLIRDQAEKMGKLLRTEQEEAQKNSAILESIEDGVMLAGSDGRIILFNSAAERILGMSQQQAVGQSVGKLAGIYGDFAPAWMELMNAWSQSDVRIDGQEDSVTERITLGEKIISTRLSPVYIGDLYLGTLSVFRDITRDVEADRAKAQFIANVSHEFRTPLTPIKGYTDLLLANAGGKLDPMQEKMLQTIKENTDRLALLVDDVLNISRLDSGDSEVHFGVVNVGKVIADEFERINAEAYNVAKRMTTRLSVQPDVPPIRADQEKLRQIFVNLIDNAFNYTRAGGTIEVDVIYDADKEVVEVAVRDTGVGIPEEFHEAAWRRFERYDQHAVELDVAGTGLGLSLARDLVQLHNGKIWFDSVVGEGTVFYVRLPVEQPKYKSATVEIPHVDSETVAGD